MYRMYLFDVGEENIKAKDKYLVKTAEDNSIKDNDCLRRDEVGSTKDGQDITLN